LVLTLAALLIDGCFGLAAWVGASIYTAYS
jgi:hypothetical protein